MTIHWSLILVPWIVNYPVDSAIQLLNNWGLTFWTRWKKNQNFLSFPVEWMTQAKTVNVRLIFDLRSWRYCTEWQWQGRNRQVSYSRTALGRAWVFNFFTKTKTNIGNLPLSRRKTIEILKEVRFQSLNFTSKPKGYLLQTTKLREKLIVLTEERKKLTKPKEELSF